MARTFFHYAIQKFKSKLFVKAGNLYIEDVQVIASANELNGIKTVNLAAPSQALTAAQSGERFVGVVDAVFSLPAAAPALKGVRYEFETGAASSGTGLAVSPASTDHIRGNGLTSVDNKDLINSGATDRVGDSVAVYCDGADWVIEGTPLGTWAKEP